MPAYNIHRQCSYIPNWAKFRELCVAAGILCAFSHSGFSRDVHNRVAGLVSVRSRVLFEGRLGTCSVYECWIPHTRHFWLPATHLPLFFWKKAFIVQGPNKNVSVCLCLRFFGDYRGKATLWCSLVHSQDYVILCEHYWQCFKQMVFLRWGGTPSICKEDHLLKNIQFLRNRLQQKASLCDKI